MKHLLIVGGCGYLVHILVPKLLYSGYRVTVLDAMWYGNYHDKHPNLKVVKFDICDFLNKKHKNEKFFEQADVVINLAGMSLELTKDLNPERTYLINGTATERIIDLAVEYGVKRFIQASSGSVYGNKSERFITEDYVCNPTTLYGELKLHIENYLRIQSIKTGMTTVCVRSSTFVGYSRRFRIDLVLNRFVVDGYFNKKIYVHGGNQLRTAIHIIDAADFYETLIDAPANIINRQSYNIVKECFTIKELAERVKEKVGCGVIIDENIIDDRSYHFVGDKAKRDLGWEPKLTLEDAIEEMLEACKKQLIRSDVKTNLQMLTAQVPYYSHCGKQ